MVICLGVFTYILMTNGKHVDSFYEKFTTPKVNSLIIGDSRGLQGIVPKEVDKSLKNSKYDLPMFNYAFTIGQARIGPLYRKSILRKLNQKSTNGLFLVSLTPLMLSSFNENSNINGEFVEMDTPPHNMCFVDKNPNYEYLIKNISYFDFKQMFKNENSFHYVLHKDGWTEVRNVPGSENTLKRWKEDQKRKFLIGAKNNSPSRYRLKSLDTLVKTLKQYGEVYLVRLPIDPDFLALENVYYPNFNDQIDSISKSNHVQYFNFRETGNRYYAFEGHHLDVNSAKLLTRDLCDSILKCQNMKKGSFRK